MRRLPHDSGRLVGENLRRVRAGLLYVPRRRGFGSHKGYISHLVLEEAQKRRTSDYLDLRSVPSARLEVSIHKSSLSEQFRGRRQSVQGLSGRFFKSGRRELERRGPPHFSQRPRRGSSRLGFSDMPQLPRSSQALERETSSRASN